MAWYRHYARRIAAEAALADGWGEPAKTAPTHTHVDRTGAMSFFICRISCAARVLSIGAARGQTQTVYCMEMAIRCMNVIDQSPTYGHIVRHAGRRVW